MFSLTAVSYLSCTAITYHMEQRYSINVTVFQMISNRISPERINPGDKQHRLPTIVKVVSGDNPETLEKLAKLYETVITAGVHRASSIKVAEAAKVIENTQRDLNIALMNELAIVFERLGIDTLEVLKAAGSKWNFLPFRPGLVGGHCIGVDPYYLTHKAQMVGYHPEVILAGRRINDGMGQFIAEQTVKMLARQGLHTAGQTVIMIGIRFRAHVTSSWLVIWKQPSPSMPHTTLSG